MEDVEALRAKFTTIGWRVREIPIKSGETIRGFKIVAAKGDRTVSAEGKTLFETLTTLGRTVGVR